jgi:hypothetical protein
MVQVANAINPTTQQFSIPYLTTQEYRNAPTAIDIDNLVFNSQDPEAQDNELANVIARASSWVDTYCNQILGATYETETQRSRTVLSNFTHDITLLLRSQIFGMVIHLPI